MIRCSFFSHLLLLTLSVYTVSLIIGYDKSQSNINELGLTLQIGLQTWRRLQSNNETLVEQRYFSLQMCEKLKSSISPEWSSDEMQGRTEPPHQKLKRGRSLVKTFNGRQKVSAYLKKLKRH